MNQNKVRRALLGSIRATYALRQRKGNFLLWAGEVDRSRDLEFFWVSQRRENLDHRSGGTTYSFPCPKRTKTLLLPREISPPYQKRASMLPSPTTTTLSLQAKRYANYPKPQLNLHGTVEYMPPSGIPFDPKNHGLQSETTFKKYNKSKNSRSPQASGKVRPTNHDPRLSHTFDPIITDITKILTNDIHYYVTYTETVSKAGTCQKYKTHSFFTTQFTRLLISSKPSYSNAISANKINKSSPKTRTKQQTPPLIPVPAWQIITPLTRPHNKWRSTQLHPFHDDATNPTTKKPRSSRKSIK